MIRNLNWKETSKKIKAEVKEIKTTEKRGKQEESLIDFCKDQ